MDVRYLQKRYRWQIHFRKRCFRPEIIQSELQIHKKPDSKRVRFFLCGALPAGYTISFQSQIRVASRAGPSASNPRSAGGSCRRSAGFLPVASLHQQLHHKLSPDLKPYTPAALRVSAAVPAPEFDGPLRPRTKPKIHTIESQMCGLLTIQYLNTQPA